MAVRRARPQVAERVYRAVEGSRFTHEQAAAFGPELERLAAFYGKLTPQLVVEEARPIASSLHGFITWDEAAAATQYRLTQARHLMNGYRVEISERESGRPTRFVAPGLVNVRLRSLDDQKLERVYLPIRQVMEDPELLAQAVQDALRGINGWRKRYEAYRGMRQFAGLEPIFDIVDRTISDLTVTDQGSISEDD